MLLDIITTYSTVITTLSDFIRIQAAVDGSNAVLLEGVKNKIKRSGDVTRQGR